MRKLLLPLSVFCLTTSFVIMPAFKAGSKRQTAVATIQANKNDAFSSGAEAAANLLYDSLHLDEMGMNKEALYLAYKGQQKLEREGAVENPDILTVCDFSQSSDRKRMYILDLKNYRVLLNTYVAHGRNSGVEFAEKFSNRIESLQSSLGFYVTKNIYFGKHGLSLKLAGQDRGFNDNAEKRAVVVHGANYIGDQRLGSAYMGRSFGCPAVPQYQANKVINLIKDGTTLFIYHPSQQYLHGSRILNG